MFTWSNLQNLFPLLQLKKKKYITPHPHPVGVVGLETHAVSDGA